MDARGAAFAVVAVILVCAFQALFYLAPEVLAKPLWEGSAVTLSFLLGTLSIAVPIAVGWVIIHADSSDGESFDTSRHG
jgi:hypothetical protein